MDTTDTSTLTTLPPIPAKVHFLGIGGISMSGLARMLHQLGYTVSGSDRQASKVTAALESDGIQVQIGHDRTELAGEADILVVTPRAIPGAPDEIAAARANGADVVRRGQLLGLLASTRRLIAVAGSDGKSSTSGMITSALVELGLDPTYSVGAIVNSTGRTADLGGGEYMVAEADEFDRALLWLAPEVGIVSTVAFDHPDQFADQDAYDEVFVAFAHRIRDGGTLVTSADHPGCQRLVDRLRRDERFSCTIVTFGQAPDADWMYQRSNGSWAIVDPDGISWQFDLHVPGQHNAANAAAAIVAMAAIGVPVPDAIRGIGAFRGVGRRFERKGSARGIEVVDDYGHHPDEVRATIAGAREQFPGRRLVVVFQPHTYSRTAKLLDEFSASLDTADVPVLLDIYPAGEVDTLGVSSQAVADRMTGETAVLPNPESAATWLLGSVREGDVVITMGAGDVTRLGDLLMKSLEDDTPAAGAQAVRPARKRPIGKGGRRKVETIPLPGSDARIQRDVDMSLHTTMRIGGPADYLVRASTPELMEAALGWAASESIPVTVIGGGSNLLVSDDGIRGLVLVVRTPGQKAEALLRAEDRGDHVELVVGAQAPISWVGRFCAEHGWSGMDWAVGLPGQIGGATVNNAGAHGTEIKDHLIGIDLFEDGELRFRDVAWLEPAYRMTRIKHAPRPRSWTVVRSRFSLPKGDPSKLVALADDHARFRRETQPTGACSGSTFANPEGDYAGRLLEAAGLKGFCMGAMQFSPKHANWVINTGGGTARAAWELIQHARSVIQERYGIDLRPEVERVGDNLD